MFCARRRRLTATWPREDRSTKDTQTSEAPLSWSSDEEYGVSPYLDDATDGVRPPDMTEAALCCGEVASSSCDSIEGRRAMIC